MMMMMMRRWWWWSSWWWWDDMLWWWWWWCCCENVRQIDIAIVLVSQWEKAKKVCGGAGLDRERERSRERTRTCIILLTLIVYVPACDSALMWMVAMALHTYSSNCSREHAIWEISSEAPPLCARLSRFSLLTLLSQCQEHLSNKGTLNNVCIWEYMKQKKKIGVHTDKKRRRGGVYVLYICGPQNSSSTASDNL